MAKVLQAAREAAAEIRERAEESVGRMLREASEESSALKAAAESVLARRSEEAEAEAASILAAAEERGREMVAEAQAVRERMLKDLSRKRKVAALQLEQMMAARQRLLSAYDVVRQNLDDVTRELEVVEEEAKLAADVAGFKPPPDDEPIEIDPHPTPPPGAVAVTEPEAVPEPAPTPEPEPEPAPAPPADDRRSSSLRLLRRKAEPAGELPPFDDDNEGVRILRPEATAAPRPVALVPEPEPEPEPGPPEPQPEVEVEAEAAVEQDDAQAPVEDLFARLRADRAAAVVQAEAVLSEPEPPAAAEVETEAEPAPEPPSAPEVVGDAAFEQRDAALESAERALTRALKRALADEQNEVLDTLRRAKRTPKLDELMPAAAAHVGRYVGVASDHLRRGAEAGASSLGGDAPDIAELAGTFGDEVVDDLRARVGRALDASSSDEEALVDAISATYREWKTARSEAFARHHLAAAYAFGVYRAAPGESLRWVVDPAEGNCPDCDDNALAGPTAKGEPYPTGQAHPPAHSGCRCLVLPVAN